MNDHTVVGLELAALFLAIWGLAFGAVYVCCCRFVKDTTAS